MSKRKRKPKSKGTAHQMEVKLTKDKMIRINNFHIGCPSCASKIKMDIKVPVPRAIREDLYKYQIFLDTFFEFPFDWETFFKFSTFPPEFEKWKFWAKERLRGVPKTFLDKDSTYDKKDTESWK